MDQDIVQPLKEKLMKNGVDIYLNHKVVSISESSEGLLLNATSEQGELSIPAEKVLLSIGRKPVIDTLNLDAIGVKTERGRILVNKYMQTNIENIYAVGDCNGKVICITNGYKIRGGVGKMVGLDMACSTFASRGVRFTVIRTLEFQISNVPE